MGMRPIDGNGSSALRTDESTVVRRVPLTQLSRGQHAVVDCSTLTHLPEEDRCLLRAMGLYDRCTVRVCRPGTPCIVQIDATRLGLSGAMAQQILVEPCDDPADAERRDEPRLA